MPWIFLREIIWLPALIALPWLALPGLFAHDLLPLGLSHLVLPDVKGAREGDLMLWLTTTPILLIVRAAHHEGTGTAQDEMDAGDLVPDLKGKARVFIESQSNGVAVSVFALRRNLEIMRKLVRKFGFLETILLGPTESWTTEREQ